MLEPDHNHDGVPLFAGKAYILICIFLLVSVKAFSGEISHPDYTLVYRMENDNEVVGITSRYSSSEREAVFERFNQLYRWNVLGIE